MRLIAHRGFAAARPENTLEAIEEAVGVADAVEVDVRRCGSGELVVIHDETIDRVTDGNGRVDDYTLAELRELNVLETGSGVPTLSETLAAVPGHVGINAELKEEGTAADVLSLLASEHPQTVVSSFSEAILEECLEADPSIPRALITADSDLDRIDSAIGLGCSYLHPSIDACSERLVNAAHRAGMSVNVWTVDSRPEAAKIAELGVDGVIADRRDVLPEEPA